MKSLLASVLLVISFSSFASDLEEVVRKVEIEKNANCIKKSESPISMCFGQVPTCLYNVKYDCISTNGDFKLKVKMKNYYDMAEAKYVTTVRGYTITTKAQK